MNITFKKLIKEEYDKLIAELSEPAVLTEAEHNALLDEVDAEYSDVVAGSSAEAASGLVEPLQTLDRLVPGEEEDIKADKPKPGTKPKKKQRQVKVYSAGAPPGSGAPPMYTLREMIKEVFQELTQEGGE